MQPRYLFTARSGNAKTGPIPVTTTSRAGCPSTCPLRGAGGCYAEAGPLRLHWDRLSASDAAERGVGLDLAGLAARVAALRPGTLWRHNQAGDLAHHDGTIDVPALATLAAANRTARARGFSYTHHVPPAANVAALKAATNAGFTINLSANGPGDVDALSAHGLPVVTVTAPDAPKVMRTPAGRRIVRCPATYRDTDCAACGLCQRADRDYAIGFPAHGLRARNAAAVADNTTTTPAPRAT